MPLNTEAVKALNTECDYLANYLCALDGCNEEGTERRNEIFSFVYKLRKFDKAARERALRSG